MRNKSSGVGRQRIFTLLENGVDLTCKAAATRAFISEREARLIMSMLYNVDGVVFVCDWIRENGRGPWIATYRLGPGEDVTCPKPLTPMQKAERCKFTSKKQGVDLRKLAPGHAKADPMALAMFPWLYDAAAIARRETNGVG